MDSQEKYALLDKLNLCHKCEKAKPFGKYKFCADCLEKNRIYCAERYSSEKAHEYQTRRREIYREKKEKGICVRCSKLATRGMYCLECSIKAKRRSQERARERKAERHERGLIPQYRIENGLCYYCGKAREDDKHGYACIECAEEMSRHSKMSSRQVYWRILNNSIFQKR